MPYSVRREGKIVDVVCRRHVQGYTVHLGDKLIGQVFDLPEGWMAVSWDKPELNYLGNGFKTRRMAIEFILRAGEWLPKR